MGENVDVGGLEPLPEQPIAVPIQASGTLTKTQVIFVIGQIVAALGALVTCLGLGEQTWIYKAVKFLQANEAVPLISLTAWVVVGIVLWLRNQKRAIERAVLAAMVSNSVGKLSGPVHPKVRAALDEAIAARSNARREDR